jgi:hypothetical protein
VNWDQIVDKVTPHVFKIETQSGHGTGFLSVYNEGKTWCGIATALHVVEHADEWQQPIRITHHATNKYLLLKDTERVIFKDAKTDSAVILFVKEDLDLPESLISLFPSNSAISIGCEVGWLGFPAVAPYDLCFFSGNVSARQAFRNAYLIDGVSIHGLSGGPVLYSTGTDGVQIIGAVTAYSANRSTGEALPGLLIAQDVSHFHDVASRIKTLDEANKKKVEFEQSQKSSRALSAD